jgi:glucosamine-6-phosphate deaminase
LPDPPLRTRFAEQALFYLTSRGGDITMVPQRTITVGPVQTWQAEKVVIWQAGVHDNRLGQRPTALMISRGLADSCPPV